MISRLKRGLDRGEHPWLKDAALNRLQRAEEQQENAWLPSPERNGKRQDTKLRSGIAAHRNKRGVAAGPCIAGLPARPSTGATSQGRWSDEK